MYVRMQVTRLVLDRPANQPWPGYPRIPRCAGVGLRDGAMLLELANSTTLRGLQVLPRCFERWQVRPHRDPITVGELLKSIKGRPTLIRLRLSFVY
ncbi:hypothetical protein TWF173_000483 [Orbilia oligospora]|nr:hypothetical protein TWF173_000483 [Orbilia oligospora]